MGIENGYSGTGAKLIILAGAGSSHDIGYPTLENVLKVAMIGDDGVDYIIRQTRVELEEETKDSAVFEALIVKLKDYERIAFALRKDHVLLETYKPVQSMRDISIEQQFSRALAKCYGILAKSYGPQVIDRNKKAFTSLSVMFDRIAKQNQNVLDVYTTNYDCSFQVLASNFDHLSFYSHINNEDGRFRDNWYKSRKDLDDAALSKIYVHRLHGCIAWFNQPDRDGGPSFSYEKHGAGGSDELSISAEELHNMCIKLIAAQLLGTNRVFASAFDEFNEHLRTVNTLLIWGYSFRDLEVTRQINQALLARADNPFKIYYVDPFLSEYKVVDNIRRTLRNAPIQISPAFRPQKIDWVPEDGREALTDQIVKITEEAYS